MNKSDFCIVTYTDQVYLPRALITIDELRNPKAGNYTGDLIVMTDGLFEISTEIIEKYNLTIKEFPDIDTTQLIQKIRQHPFRNWDNREYNKTKQWNKMYVFDVYFKKWKYIMFVDAGLRVFDDINIFKNSCIPNALVAMDDGHPDFTKKFDCQIELSNTEVVSELSKVFNIHSSYFLNCLFIFDTALISENTVGNLIDLMNKYPICKTNEMAIMNIYFTKVWIPMITDLKNVSGHSDKILFDWSERYGNTWKNYVTLKYPSTK